ncbi:MAG: polyphenol oxidase family protein [Actinomycetota bacterium]|nr:polyphenol oxidase family protein [Actinomycetota bacterium]
MDLTPPFRRLGEHIAIDLLGARALFTTRRGGVSGGAYASLNLGWLTDDELGNVDANRARVGDLVGIEPERFAQGRQVHEARVRLRRRPPDPAEWPLDPADGQATCLPGVAPIVLVADCLPVALAAPEAVAMLHCGWRGLASGIVAEGIDAVRELGARGPIAAAIGPGAGPCCYEVGEDVHERFAPYGPDVRRGRALDLKLVARRALAAQGVTDVHDVGLCTMCADPELFFSHRRDDGATGRQGGIVWRS